MDEKTQNELIQLMDYLSDTVKDNYLCDCCRHEDDNGRYQNVYEAARYVDREWKKLRAKDE
jgi:hypothetical protein